MQIAEEQKKVSGTLTTAQRWAGLYTDVLMFLLLAFFAWHQWHKTGFFTDKYGWLEMLALYMPILISLAPPIQRFIQGRRDPTRLLEAFTDLSLGVGSLWLWIRFPFDFTHLADPFPTMMRSAFAWINNTVGKWILLLQVIIGFLSCISVIVAYLRQSRENAGNHAG